MKLISSLLFAMMALTVFCQPARDTAGQQAYRPRFHFTAAQGWINDPNGLVWHQGAYHLFFQANPFGSKWGHMSWGHALSKDLVHWQRLAIALPEEKNFMIFSGSAVSDLHNSSGFARGKEVPLVTVYTAHTDTNQSQHLAYSLNDGKSWQQYDHNPILDLHKRDFRDPNVTWYEKGKYWLMAVSWPIERKIVFYASPNLKNWKWLSDFGPAGDTLGAWECPDLMQVPVAGEKDRSKWVLFVSQNASMQYFVGNFDGARFINENPQDRICRPDEGPDYYAAVTYHLGQDKSPVSIGWVNNWNYANDVPTFSWRGAMSLPRKLSLKKINDHWVLRQEPIPALRSLRGAPLLHRRQLVVDSEKILDAQSTQCELSVSWKPHPGCVSGLELAAGATKPVMVGYDAKTGRLFIERTGAGDTTFNRAYGMLSTFSAPLVLADGLVRLHIFFDHSIVEVFAGDGELVMTAQVFSAPAARKIGLFSRGCRTKFSDLDIWEINSIW